MLHRNLWMLRIPISTPPVTPHSVAWMERGLACLRGTGPGEGEKIQVILLVSGFVRNEATLAADLQAAARASGRSMEETMASSTRLLGRVTGPERFPAVTAVLASGVVDRPDGPDDAFVFGLDRLLDGVEVLVRARTAPGR